MENILAILGVGAVTMVVTVIVVVAFSSRARTHGIVGALRHELSATSKRRNPYKG